MPVKLTGKMLFFPVGSKNAFTFPEENRKFKFFSAKGCPASFRFFFDHFLPFPCIFSRRMI